MEKRSDHMRSIRKHVETHSDSKVRTDVTITKEACWWQVWIAAAAQSHSLMSLSCEHLPAAKTGIIIDQSVFLQNKMWC